MSDATMDHMFSISDNESEGSDDAGHASNPSCVPRRTDSKLGHTLTVADVQQGELAGRVRLYSESEALLSRGEEHDGSEAGGPDEGGDGMPFRGRSRSAPPELWAAKRYGQQLRRMSDEFDILLDKGMKRVRSAGAARQMRPSPSWFAFLWSHKETEAEIGGSTQ